MKQATRVLYLGLFTFFCALSRANANTLFSYTRELVGMYLVSNTFPDFTLSFAIQTNVNYSDRVSLFEVHWTTNDIGATLTATSATNSRFDIFAAKMTDGNTNELYYTLSLPSVTVLWSFDEPSAYFNGEPGSPADLQGNQIDSISLKLNSLSLSSGTPEDPYVLFTYNLTLSAQGQAIPEPATWSLLVVGVLPLLVTRRLRRL